MEPERSNRLVRMTLRAPPRLLDYGTHLRVLLHRKSQSKMIVEGMLHYYRLLAENLVYEDNNKSPIAKEILRYCETEIAKINDSEEEIEE